MRKDNNLLNEKQNDIETSTMEEKPTRRLESLDILRGADLFCLVVLEGVLYTWDEICDASWFEQSMWYFRHVSWEGFSSWDLVMPLFLFMAGVSIHFSLSKYKNSIGKAAAYKRVLKRVAVLWLLGMVCEGNLLSLDPTRINLYSNTLQAIAMGYLIASLVYLNMKWRLQICAAICLLLIYWGVMEFVTIGSYGGGNYSEEYNMAEWVDRAVLGRFRNFSSTENGTVVFADFYHYTWVLSSLNFGVTTLTGLFAGELLKNGNIRAINKILVLIIGGSGMALTGWLCNEYIPVIKKIWTSSMVLVSSGYCFILMGIFFYIIDYKGYRRHLTWLKIYGMNSIAAYMLTMCISFRSVAHSLLYGFEQYTGSYYPLLLELANAAIIFLILRYMYQKNIYLRV